MESQWRGIHVHEATSEVDGRCQILASLSTSNMSIDASMRPSSTQQSVRWKDMSSPKLRQNSGEEQQRQTVMCKCSSPCDSLMKKTWPHAGERCCYSPYLLVADNPPSIFPRTNPALGYPSCCFIGVNSIDAGLFSRPWPLLSRESLLEG